MGIHDINFYNQSLVNKKYYDNYELNAYKMKKLFLKNEFLNKIKKDVIRLKFDNTLKLDLDK